MSTATFLTDLVSPDAQQAPSNYNICTLYEKPNFAEIEVFQGSIPLIDLEDLQGPRRSHAIAQIGQACHDYGFFMVKNHGIPETMINSAVDVTREFFQLPASEKSKFCPDGTPKPVTLTTGFNMKTQKVAYWKDALRFRSYPVQDYVNEWPSNPPSFRKHVGEYCTSVRGLALQLLEAISESLGLERDCIDKKMSKHGQNIALNYYPPCPQPELTCGAPGHTDPSVITLLFPDRVPGLQILKDGKWMAINPIPNTFVVNVGDIMQVLSNDKYKSVRHRAVVNSNKERISIAAFFFPSGDAVVGPPKELIDDDHPAVYETFTFSKFFAAVSGGSDLATRCPLDLFKCSAV